MIRYVFLLHRYLGIAVGLVICVWCLSGIVMMYVQYPELTPAQEKATLEALDLSACCDLPAAPASQLRPIEALRVEMMAGVPVLRMVYSDGERRTIDLSSGEAVRRLTGAQADAVAASFASVAGIGDYRSAGPLERDQWTVYGAYDPHRPLYRFEGADRARTNWYISSATGEVVQITTRWERFWNWLGAVPHWLYPTVLRQHTAVWSQVVIWLTIVGVFLTLPGIYVGLRQFRKRRSRRYSPYRGAALWHHYAGLVFGAFILTFLVSGFFSMNPWGALESRSFGREVRRQRGTDITLDANLRAEIEQLKRLNLPPDTVRFDAHVVDGERFFVASDRVGTSSRPQEQLGDIAAFTRRALMEAPQRLRPGIGVREKGWIDKYDAYYYSHHDELPLPVYRIIYADAERYYLDGLTGQIIRAVDVNRRWYRWLHYALHRGDFAAVLRARPWWDTFMLPLMVGVSLSALTGTWMGLRRVRRWFSRRDKRVAGTDPGRNVSPEVSSGAPRRAAS
jgi:hypothetical protein